MSDSVKVAPVMGPTATTLPMTVIAVRYLAGLLILRVMVLRRLLRVL